MDISIPAPAKRQFGILPFAVIPVFLLLLPFLFTPFPPSTDLPQHLSQLYLLKEALSGSTDLFFINWYAPNNLVYFLIAAIETVFTPQLSGKVLLIILVLFWIGSIYFLAWNRHRPLENAILITFLFFSHAFYWGFLNFLMGLPVFLIFLAQSLKPMGKRNWLTIFFLTLFLYGSHALWFLMGSIFLLVQAAFERKGFKYFLYRTSPLIPIGTISIFWFHSLSSARAVSGFDTAPHWFTSPVDRISPIYLRDSILGGIEGHMEAIVACIILIWIVVALYTNRKHLMQRTDLSLLAGSLLLFCMVFIAPDKYMNTIFFSQRWFPCAVALLVLALPAPTINRFLLRIGTTCVIAFFAIESSRNWSLFYKNELSGLEESLRALPERQQLIGLDFIKNSDYIKGRPFLQTFAYAQATKGGELNFSFAEHSSGIVSYKEPRKIHWTPGLEWLAERVTLRDLQHFDYALVNGNTQLHKEISSLENATPVTQDGRWRLYRIQR